MAEFCLECWNRINETNDSPKKYVISKDLDLCEGCGEWKHVIVMKRKSYYIRKYRFFLFPLKVITIIIYIFCRLLILPYIVYKHLKEEKT